MASKIEFFKFKIVSYQKPQSIFLLLKIVKLWDRVTVERFHLKVETQNEFFHSNELVHEFH